MRRRAFSEQVLSYSAGACTAGSRSQHFQWSRSKTVYGGHEHALRQTLIALTGGQELHEHENPGEATVHILQGRVELRADEVAWNGSPGDLLIVPDARHSLAAIEDSVVLLTVAKQL